MSALARLRQGLPIELDPIEPEPAPPPAMVRGLARAQPNSILLRSQPGSRQLALSLPRFLARPGSTCRVRGWAPAVESHKLSDTAFTGVQPIHEAVQAASDVEHSEVQSRRGRCSRTLYPMCSVFVLQSLRGRWDVRDTVRRRSNLRIHVGNVRLPRRNVESCGISTSGICCEAYGLDSK